MPQTILSFMRGQASVSRARPASHPQDKQPHHLAEAPCIIHVLRRPPASARRADAAPARLPQRPPPELSSFHETLALARRQSRSLASTVGPGMQASSSESALSRPSGSPVLPAELAAFKPLPAPDHLAQAHRQVPAPVDDTEATRCGCLPCFDASRPGAR